MTSISGTSRPAYVYDQETDSWIPVGVGPHTHTGYIDTTLIDAAGDLIVGSAPDTAAKLAVGSNGTYLKVNTSLSNKLEWAEISSSSPDSDQSILAGQIFG